MKITHKTSSLFKIAATVLVAIGYISSTQAVNVLVSGINSGATGDQQIINFINNNFQNVNLTYGDYSDTTSAATLTALASADVFIIGRAVSSGNYTTSDNSVYDSLTIPMVVLTSYVSRTGGGAQGLRWESGGLGSFLTTGTETTVTAAGAAVFGTAGSYDWWSGAYTSWGAGNGTVGSGQVLATVGSENLAVGWNVGGTDALGNTFSGRRLLFEVPSQDAPGPAGSIVPNTAAGQQAFIGALAAYTPLQPNAVPEPSTLALGGFSGLAFLMAIRRQKK